MHKNGKSVAEFDLLNQKFEDATSDELRTMHASIGLEKPGQIKAAHDRSYLPYELTCGSVKQPNTMSRYASDTSLDTKA